MNASKEILISRDLRVVVRGPGETALEEMEPDAMGREAWHRVPCKVEYSSVWESALAALGELALQRGGT